MTHPDGRPHSPVRAWAAVLVLTLVGVLNFADRFLPSILAEPIKHDLALSDTALGLINGFGFLAVYAVLGIAIARLSDRGAYGLVVAASLATWSMMTALGGFVSNGWQLALTRMGVAVGEAGSTPAAHAYISRNFAPSRRGTPLALLTLAVPVSGTAGLLAGGLLGEALGWRMTFIVMGGLSLTVVPFVLLLLGARQPVPPVAAGAASGAGGALGLLRKRSYLAIVLGAASIAVAGYSLTTFTPAFLARAHGLPIGEIGVKYGLASGVAGIAGVLLIGPLADRVAARDPRGPLWVVAGMIVLFLPFSCSAYLVPGPVTAVWFIAIANVVGSAWMPPTIAAIQRLAPVEQRATASAVLLFFSGILGALGPLVTGMISDAYTPSLGNLALGRALLIVPVMHVVALVFYLVATRSFAREMLPEDR